MGDEEILFTIIQSRRSLRRYESRPVSDDILQSILTAATWAPSAHNRQPWRFVVIRSTDVKERLAQAMGARLRRDLEQDHVPASVIDRDVMRSYERLTSAPVVVMVCLSMMDMDRYGDKRRDGHEWTMAVQSTAMAGQNLLLMAHAYGLGACWMCAPLFCPDAVRAALDLPEDWQPQGLITMGYPAQQREKSREPLETKILWK